MKTVPSVVLSKMLDYDDVYDSESPMSLYYVITEYTDTEKYQYRYTNFDDVLEHLDRYKPTQYYLKESIGQYAFTGS
jgi:hypothetical protein